MRITCVANGSRYNCDIHSTAHKAEEVILEITRRPGVPQCGVYHESSGSFREANGVPSKIIHGVVPAKEDIACTQMLVTSAIIANSRHIPTIHNEPPGRLMSNPVKAEIHVP